MLLLGSGVVDDDDDEEEDEEDEEDEDDEDDGELPVQITRWGSPPVGSASVALESSVPT